LLTSESFKRISAVCYLCTVFPHYHRFTVHLVLGLYKTRVSGKPLECDGTSIFP